jgi:chromate reductase, NAD(P)H dehydrogenase (quinone)
MKKYRILAISGSMKTNSTNEKILRTIAKFYDKDLSVEIFTGIAELPHFNSDLDTDEPPASVQRFRALIDKQTAS